MFYIMIYNRVLSGLFFSVVLGFTFSGWAENSYVIPTGTTFSMGNSGASHYTFDLTTYGGGSSEYDPTLVLVAGETYEFKRITAGHNVVILQDVRQESALSFSSGAWSRLSSLLDSSYWQSAGVENNNSAMVTFTPVTPGVYFYTCIVSGHVGMTGQLIVVDEDHYETTATKYLDEAVVNDVVISTSNSVASIVLVLEQSTNLLVDAWGVMKHVTNSVPVSEDTAFFRFRFE